MAELASRDTVDGRSQGAEEEGGNPAEDEPATSARRRLLALVLRTSEKEILSLAASELEARFDKQLHALVKGAGAQAAACREAGSSWPSMLKRRESVLQQQAERIGLPYISPISPPYLPRCPSASSHPSASTSSCPST